VKTEILIVGGGLSGLHTAATLHAVGREVALIEARSRLGGRILSASFGNAYFDLGPAWFWPGQAHMDSLIDELSLRIFPQQSDGAALYEDEHGRIQRMNGSPMEGAYRIEGGMGAIISALAERIPTACIQLNSEATHFRKTSAGIETTIRSNGYLKTILSERVILALPPRLISGLSFEPTLTKPLSSALQQIPSWMAGHAKFIAFFDAPFWRAEGFSGEAISQRGPLMEIHDASPNSGGPYALFGFVGTPPSQRKALGEQPIKEVLEQLQRLFGDSVRHPLAYRVQDWGQELFSATELDLTPLNYHPNYGYSAEAFDLWDGSLLLSGTETAEQYGGFLEGALDSSVRTVRKVSSVIRNK
jgi:monoamine oxidase